MLKRITLLLLVTGAFCACFAQTDVPALVTRLDNLEAENRKLVEELASLRRDLAAYQSQAQEQSAVVASRTEELAQAKVETSQRMPVSLTGMLLFNAFANGRSSGGQEDPVLALPFAGHANSGATLRQTVLGVKFNGPDLPLGGKADGNLFMDFYAGSADPARNYFHLRLAMLNLNWKDTTVSFGQDKPLISPREPDSLAQVGVSPLTAAGNLWDWQPQVRVERRFHFTESTGLRAQGSIYMTNESDAGVAAEYTSSQEGTRPGFEGRFELFHETPGTAFAIAPGFHVSDSHVAGTSVASRIASLDWRVTPSRVFSFKGTWFRGQNVAPLGALGQGYSIHGQRSVTPVHSLGGWAQISISPTSKLTLNLYSGLEKDRAADLAASGVSRNFLYAGNFVYHLAPNVLTSFEASQARTNFIGLGTRLNNHYDLALAYLF